MPTVSVVIPAYRHAEHIAEALLSVYAQTYSDFEVIVVNDGSPDQTSDAVRPFLSKGNLRYVEQSNAGQAVARNRGVALATGEFIALLDDDDVWRPDKLAWQVDAMREHADAVMVWGPATDLGSGMALLPCSPGEGARWQGSNVLATIRVVSPGQTLMRRTAFEAVGGLDVNLWGTDDWDLYIRLGEIGRFHYDPRVALLYRRHPQNASRDVARLTENVGRLRAKHYPKIAARVLRDETDAAGRRCRSDRFDDLMWLALDAFAKGDFRTSRRFWMASARAHPIRLFSTQAWRKAKAAFVPQLLRPVWRRMRRGTWA